EASARTAETTAPSSLTICGLMAFSRCGRARRTQPTESSTSKRRVSYIVSHHGQSAAHGQGLPGDEGGIVGGEEGDGGGDLVGLTDAPERYGALEGFDQLRVVRRDVFQQLRVRRPGADHVDVDLVAGDLASERLGETDDARLGGGIHGLAARADPARVGADADDPAAAALDHAVEHGACHA